MACSVYHASSFIGDSVHNCSISHFCIPELDTGIAGTTYALVPFKEQEGSLEHKTLSGLRVLVYQHSAVGRDVLPRILSELGAEVATAGRSETFVSIDTENITDEQLNRLEEFAAAGEAAGRFMPSCPPTATPIGRS